MSIIATAPLRNTSARQRRNGSGCAPQVHPVGRVRVDVRSRRRMAASPADGRPAPCDGAHLGDAWGEGDARVRAMPQAADHLSIFAPVPAVEREEGEERPYVPVRLTARGRRLCGVLAGLALLVALVSVAWPASADSEPSGTAQLTVTSGDSLWVIADEVAPGEDAGVVVDDIIDLNDLPSGGELQVGQTLTVPVY